jgi:hypothetical protein
MHKLEKNRLQAIQRQIMFQLIEMLQGQNENFLLETLKMIKKLGEQGINNIFFCGCWCEKEEINDVFRQLGAIHALGPLLQSNNTTIINEASMASSTLRKCSMLRNACTSFNTFVGEGGTRNFGFGFNKETGFFDLTVLIQQFTHSKVETAWKGLRSTIININFYFKVWDAGVILAQ